MKNTQAGQEIQTERNINLPNDELKADKNNENNNDVSRKIDWVDQIKTYGSPYYAKFFVIFAIFGFVFIMPGNLFSRAVNVGVTIATLSIDMWVIKKQSTFCEYNKLKGIQFVYLTILMFIFVLTAFIALYSVLNPLNENEVFFTVCLIVFSFLGLFSPLLELIYSIPLDD